jgi:hypothetical protein
MDETALSDFALLAPEKVSIRLLSDQHSVKLGSTASSTTTRSPPTSTISIRFRAHGRHVFESRLTRDHGLGKRQRPVGAEPSLTAQVVAK